MSFVLTSGMSTWILKDEGNLLFSQKAYYLADVKYTEALEHDPNDAVLWANRAACKLSMKQFSQAADDAQIAVQLDPTYTKAWVRLATAYEGQKSFLRAIHAWDKALESFTVLSNDDASLRKQREKYQTARDNARLAIELAFPGTQYGRQPWQAAQFKIQGLRDQENTTSSAWVIAAAYETFNSASQLMMQSGDVPPDPDQPVPCTYISVLEGLTDGVMMDDRVFHTDSLDWMNRYTEQVAAQTQQHRAWTDSTPEVLMQEAPARIALEGWAGVSLALSTTVRAWIMRGFLDGRIHKRAGVAVKYLRQALNVLTWGRTFWDGDVQERGTIFKDSFIVGVRSMYLEVIREAYLQRGSPAFTLETLYDVASEVLKETNASPGYSPNTAFTIAFYNYPRGRALGVIGYCHAMYGDREKAKGKSAGVELLRDHYRRAAEAYQRAAEAYDPDDEYHAWYLHSSLQNMIAAGTPLRVVLETMERIRNSMSQMYKIWTSSGLARKGRDTVLNKMLKQEKMARMLVEQGKFGLDECVMLG